MTANDCYRPPVDAQLRYIVQWFHEWSEMQRGDFLPILAQKLAPGSYVNGLVSGVENLGCEDGRPPSLFQCRVKLFREWFETWGQAERDQLLGHIKSMDPPFYTKVQEELESVSPGNGPVNHSDDTESLVVANGVVSTTEDTSVLNSIDSASTVEASENGITESSPAED